MVASEEIRRMVAELLSEQLFAVLSTQGEDKLHSVLVAFAPAADMRQIIFVTPRSTRKFENIQKHNYVSLFIDNRKNDITDLQRLIGVEARGEVEEIDAGDRSYYRELFLAKFPHFNWFVESPGNAILGIKVQRYDVVHHFQNVTVLEML
ncbi:MAG: pyridoxamine 5'-phosphate oxidase family protein [Spirochaetia bacterium]|nr:pyridoxamine 5'-phosphate oxidase family protein [Spirochaetia bacterium]